MENPPPPQPPPPATTDHVPPPDTSSLQTATSSADKLRFMCSYGGHIVPRPHDKHLCYVGGETRMVVVDRRGTTLTELTSRLSRTLKSPPSNFTVKYQLPNEDLDSLISVTTDEDLENMIEEYERLNSNSNTSSTAAKTNRLRIFLFPNKPESVSSIGSLLESSTKSEDWFLSALNGASSTFSDSSSVNCLLGLDDAVSVPDKGKEVKLAGAGSAKSLGGGQDVHSVPDSPMLDTTSSFGSASSSPSLANLPPIKVHVDENRERERERIVADELEKLNLKKDDGNGGGGGFMANSSSPGTNAGGFGMVTGLPVGTQAVGFASDERSDYLGFGNVQNQQQLQQTLLVPPQFQQKQAVSVESASPDSHSSDQSLKNPLSVQKPVVYQDQIAQIQVSNNRVSPGNTIDPNSFDQNAKIQMQQHLQQQQQQQQQILDSGYLMPTSQYDPQHSQLHHHQQFVHPGAQYIHHHPSGAVPMGSYYQMYPPQQQHIDQQNFVYYVPSRPPQGYSLSYQQPSYSETSPAANPNRNPTPPPPAAFRNGPSPTATAVPSSELPPGSYRTATSAAPQLVQISSGQAQPQYVGYTQINPSQTVVPTSGASNYGYEYADPTHGHMYYAQPLPPQSAAQYQTMKPNLTETGSNLAADINAQQQQVRTSP